MAYNVRIVNISIVGVGIEADEMIEPGLVFFEDQVGGHKFGVITWCRKEEGTYRAGVHFVMLARDEERYLLEQVRLSCSQDVVRDPEKIITVLLDRIQREIKR